MRLLNKIRWSYFIVPRVVHFQLVPFYILQEHLMVSRYEALIANGSRNYCVTKQKQLKATLNALLKRQKAKYFLLNDGANIDLHIPFAKTIMVFIFSTF